MAAPTLSIHVTSLKTDLVSFSQQCLFFIISVFFLTSFSPIEMQTCDTNFTHTATKISVVPKENATLPYLCFFPSVPFNLWTAYQKHTPPPLKLARPGAIVSFQYIFHNCSIKLKVKIFVFVFKCSRGSK